MELQINFSMTLHKILFCFVIIHGVSIVTVYTATVPENVLPINQNDQSQLPPLILPSDASPSNETAINILMSKIKEQDGNDIREDTTRSSEITKTVTAITTPKPAHIEPTETDVEEVDENLKEEVEEIQSDDSEEDIGLEEQFHKQESSNLQLNPEFAEDIETNNDSLHGGHITAIFAGVFAFVAVAIYIGLITWRSYLEKRYGMREQLVTEDDYYNNNDIRHFAL